MAKRNEEQAPGGILPGTVIDGRYRVVRSIGQGGNGFVHEVEHLLTGRHLALKSLVDETGFARLEQEARASSLMKNGHTAKITDMGTGGPSGPYLVMELLEGQSLRELLDETGQLPLELTINIVLQVCECLAEANGLGIIHRDLKPDNVFLCVSPWPGQHDVKVLDFGIVKIAGDGPIPQSSLTRTGSTVGTPYYMSLEQLRNSSAVDARADIYSLGVVLYECLSGRKPFQADTIGDLVYALCSGPPTHLARLRPDLPPDVCEVVMRTLSMNREDRPSSMTELAGSLLSHGNSAFGLWMRAAAKGPSALRPRGPSAPPMLKSAPPQAARRTPLPSATSTEFAAPKFTPVTSSHADENPALARTEPPPPDMLLAEDATEGGDTLSIHEMDDRRPSSDTPRDTPTEMYVKEAVGAIEAMHVVDLQTDRDTPTRALGGAFDRSFGDVMKTRAQSPDAGAASARGVGHAFDLAAAQPSLPGNDPAQPDGARWGPPLHGSSLMPGAASASFPGAAADAPAQRPSEDLAPYSSSLPQRSDLLAKFPRVKVWLDRALLTAGNFIEENAKRFRAAPQRLQMMILCLAGMVTILLIGLFLLLMFRR